jgi:small subunit ribosomal protein S5
MEEKKVQTPSSNVAKEGEQKNSGQQNRRPFNSHGRRPYGNNDGLESKMIGIKQINKTTTAGRRMRFSALVVVGNRKGLVGFGIGKSNEVPVAIRKAESDAKKNLVSILINNRGTLFHEVELKNGACHVIIKPAPSGTGIKAGGATRTVLELAGFKDAVSKRLGSSSKLNMIETTVKALQSQKTPGQYAKLRDTTIQNLDAKHRDSSKEIKAHKGGNK